MNSQEALAVLDKKMSKKIKPPLSKAEIIEAMTQAVFNKRQANFEDLQKKAAKAQAELKEAVGKLLPSVVLPEHMNGTPYSNTDAEMQVTCYVKFPKSLVEKYYRAVKANPEPGYNMKPDYFRLKKEIKQQLSNKPALRIQELLKDESIQKKFLQAGEEVLASNEPEVKTLTIN